jgi:hypothetical protein
VRARTVAAVRVAVGVTVPAAVVRSFAARLVITPVAIVREGFGGCRDHAQSDWKDQSGHELSLREAAHESSERGLQ